MTVAVFILLGLFLCFFGARSIRFAIIVAGFLGSWLIADALDAGTGTTCWWPQPAPRAPWC